LVLYVLERPEQLRAVRVGLVALGGAAIAWEILARTRGIDTVAQLCALAAYVAVLCAAVFFYIDWHIDLDPSMAWLVTAVSAFALQELHWFMLIVGGAAGADPQSAWTALFQVVVCLGLCLLATSARHLPVRRDPLALGMTIGLGVILGRFLLFAAPLPEPSVEVYAAVAVILAPAVVWSAVSVLRTPILEPELRRWIGAASVLLGLGQVAAFSALVPSGVMIASMITNLAGAAILSVTATRRARGAVVEEVAAVGVLRSRLEDAETDLHTDQAQRHEIRATLAGVSTASHLLHRPGLSRVRRGQLEEMVDAELARLARLVSEDPAGASSGPVELDATLRPVIVRHDALGLAVSWRPSGHVAMARADDVAEIVSILLSNAHRHAPGSPVTVDVADAADRIRIVVTDSGPGIDPRLGQDAFGWGVRTVSSPGEGVGLAAARFLAERMGGHLVLAADRSVGASLVLDLPAVSTPALQDVAR
jgi:signal transduction histidine kinase